MLDRKLWQHTKAKVTKVKTTAPIRQKRSRAWLNVFTLRLFVATNRCAPTPQGIEGPARTFHSAAEPQPKDTDTG